MRTPRGINKVVSSKSRAEKGLHHVIVVIHYIKGLSVKEVNARRMEIGWRLALRVNGKGRKWEVNLLLFADDTALVGGSEEKKINRLVKETREVCERRALIVYV